MPSAPINPGKRGGLGPYWLGAAACVILLAGYVAIITSLHTETAGRSTAPPWFSWFRYPLTRTPGQIVYLILPVIVFAAWLATVRRLIRKRLSPAITPMFGFAAVLLLNITVAMMDGSPSAIWKPFDRGSEFFSDVPKVHGVAPFLRDYVARLPQYSVHTRTHPPGAVLFLYFVSRIFGPGIVAAAWAAVVVTATGIAPFYLLARRLIGDEAALRAIALYPLTPSLVLFGATSMDGVILVPLLWSIYFLHRTIIDGRWSDTIAAAISLGIGLMFSYVTVCIGMLTLIHAIFESANRPARLPRIAALLALCAILTAALICVLYPLTGFNYLSCLRVSRFYDHYSMKTFTMSFGRYLDISFSNLIAFLIGLGLPAVILWGRETIASLKPQTEIERFNIALAASVLIFSFARLFTHETERVWLFFAPLVLISSASWIARQKQSDGKLLEWAIWLSFAQTWLFQIFLYTIW